MVISVTSLGRSGTSDWLIQRASAFILLAYTVFIVGYLLSHSNLTYQDWHALFAHDAVKIFSLLALLSLCAHSWIGIWSITTDYLTTRMLGAKGTGVRIIVQFLCALVTFVYLVWGVLILWGF